MSPPVTRRELFHGVGAAALSTALPGLLQAADRNSAAALQWLDGAPPSQHTGTSWGAAWPRGTVAADSALSLQGADGKAIPVQSWTLATWPDGSLKWSGHAVAADAALQAGLKLVPGQPARAATPIKVVEDRETLRIDTGRIRCTLNKQGGRLIESIERDGHLLARDGRLVCRLRNSPDNDDGELRIQAFNGDIDELQLEQSGPLRAVVRIAGRHRNADRAWLPFIVRLYLHAGSDAIRILHTIVFDGDPQSDFISGLGLQFSAPQRDALHDRHLRFSTVDGGVFAEAVRGLTGLRRDPGDAVRQAQIDGRATPPVSTFPDTVGPRLHLIPAFGDWRLCQAGPEGYSLRKRTQAGYTWLEANHGRRAEGLAYLGGPSGGLALGLRHFWQSHPAQIDIRGAAGDEAEMTMWLWAPDAPPMDLRGFHDGMGQDDYAEQLEGLAITYEDYEPGFDNAQGVARTSELFLWALPHTPTREQFVSLSAQLSAPPRIVCTPQWLHQCGVFGGLFSLPDRSTPARADIENRLDAYFDYYRGQTEQRHWTGFWNYGDVMHTYDRDRHVWRYDVGGFAWDNSELSTDLWLWTHYLRSGRADVFRYAEAMTRHTGEVDVHHIGRFAPLGSRHNVLHWGCSAKQLRISTAANRRYYYYLTADERVGELMREQIEAVRRLATIQAGRKLPNAEPAPGEGAPSAHVGFGTDWGAVSAAWLTEWERSGDHRIRDRLFNSMRTIAAQPQGFFTGGATLDFDSGRFEISHDTEAGASHLSAVFGLFEVCTELLQLTDIPEFRRAWLDYCRLYGSTHEEQIAELGNHFGLLNLEQGHARLTAYAARELDNERLRQRAWQEFYAGKGGIRPGVPMQTTRIEPPLVPAAVDELAWASTNAVAQWGLAAMQCLALIGEPEPSA